MRLNARLLLPLLALGAALPAAAAARAADSDVEAELVSNVSTLKPGESCLVALKLTTHAGWHIYWGRNSGDAGIPTDIKWSATGGTVEALEMPVPEKFVSAGPITCYGYTGETYFLAKVTAGKYASDAVKVTADASWLCCKEACLPGGKKLDLSVAVGAESKAANTDDFAKAEALIPAATPPGNFDLKTKAEAGDKKGDVKVALDLTAPNFVPPPPEHNTPQIFPASDKVQITGGITYIGHHNGSGDSIGFTVHMMASQKDPAHVPFLITYKDNGQTKGFFTTVDLTPAAASQ